MQLAIPAGGGDVAIVCGRVDDDRSDITVAGIGEDGDEADGVEE